MNTDALDRLIAALPVSLLYDTDESIPRGGGQIYPAWAGLPSFILIHPEDVEVMRAGLPPRVHLEHVRDFMARTTRRAAPEAHPPEGGPPPEARS